MQPFVSILMAAVLIIHAAFGCCWHHAHSCVPKASMSVTCCNHHDHDDHRQPGESELDCEGTCQYVAPEKLRLDDPSLAAWAQLVAPPVTFAGRPIDAATRIGKPPCPIDSGPPLRLHLLHQWLLI